jgi:hypothetical protein
VRTRLAALAAIFFAAHLAFLSPTLEDIDSINLALGVRDYDVAQHRPHPPGYPVFTALAKGSTALFNAAGVPSAEPRALAFWSVLAGTLLVPLVFLLLQELVADRRTAFWTSVVACFSPLAWFTSARPMSDMTGLALAVASQALLVSALTGRGTARALIAGAFLAGLASGVRMQVAILTVPLLAVALVWSPPAVSIGARVRAAAAAAAGVLAWAIPLLVVTRGPSAYLAALRSQAGEHFVEVVLWRTPTDPRAIFHAVVNVFVWPWGTLTLGLIVVCFVTAGLLFTLLRARRDVALVALAFGPYAVFHLLFQETFALRYDVPLMIPFAWLAVRGAGALRLSPYAEIALVALGLVAAVPATTAFGNGSPGFAATTDAMRTGGTFSGHAGFRRLWQWVDDGSGRANFLQAPHGYEWLTLLEQWQKDPGARVQFLANPKRTDHLVLIDAQARRSVHNYGWGFDDWPYLGGARPRGVTRILFERPGWVLDRGWAVSAEVAGLTERDGYGPHRRPSVAWLRSRDDGATLMIGGRHLGAPGDPRARIVAETGGRRIDEWRVEPGFFFRLVPLTAGALAAVGGASRDGLISLTVRSEPAEVRVALEQFDLQPAGNVMVGAAEGWHEPEYNRSTGRAWRWASERAVLWVRPVGRDVTLTIDAEAPLRYFDVAPSLRVAVGGRELARLSPADDFRWEVTLPAALLEAAAGSVVLETDKWFVPATREGSADQRHLALRVYAFGVR